MSELRLAAPVEALVQRGKIVSDDVLELRRDVFADGIVGTEEAEALFAIDTAVSDKCQEWSVFFVEALVDFVVRQARPEGYVSEENAAWLQRCISKDGVVETAGELELLVKVLETAQSSPGSLVRFALDQVKEAVVKGDGPLMNGSHLRPGAIERAEVELIRRILYAYGGDGAVAISKTEAEALFDINDVTVESENDPAWSDLFVRAIGAYLMAASGYQAPDRQTALKLQKWVESEQGLNWGDMFNSEARQSSLLDSIKDVFTMDEGPVEQAWRARNEAFEANAVENAAITQDEAHWIVDRIGRDGVFRETEKALLRFIADETDVLPSALKPLVAEARAKVAGSKCGSASFGKRQSSAA